MIAKSLFKENQSKYDFADYENILGNSKVIFQRKIA